MDPRALKVEERLTRDGVPQFESAVKAARGEPLAVRAERKARGFKLVRLHRTKGVSGGRAPDRHHSAQVRCGQAGAIGTEPDAQHFIVFRKCSSYLPGGEVPEPHRLVRA